MSDTINRMADDVAIGTPHSRATVTTHEVLTIPAEMVGKYCFFAAQTTDVFIRFGTDANVEASISAVSTVSATVLSAVATVAHLYVPAGSERHIRLKSAWTHMAHESADALGFFRFGLAQGQYGAD
jgi:hypothetical protein